MAEEIKQEVKQESKPEKAYRKTEVVASVAPAILDTKTNKPLTMDEAIIELLNKVDRIEKSVA